MLWIVLGILAAGVVNLWITCRCCGLNHWLRRQQRANRGLVHWEDKGPTPLGEKGYTPQGMTWVAGKIIFANSWKNTNSRVYEIDPENMALLRHFDMPAGAVHTSGLAWDGTHLWAVDYISNRGYCINLEGSLSSGQVQLVGDFDTTLQGTSACCMIPWNGRQCLAISNFMRTRKTIIVRHDDALKTGTVAGHIEFEYTNEGFSQGLEYVDGYLHEAENKYGVDVVNKMSLEKLRETGCARRATVKQYAAPSQGVEDLAWDGESFWTSDESVFRFFRGRLDPQ